MKRQKCKFQKLLITLLFLILTSCKQKFPNPVRTGMESKPIPNFSVLLPDSSTYFSSKNLKSGKKILLFYYRPTCPYSRMQMHNIISHISEFKNEQVCIITAADFRSMKEFSTYFNLKRYPNIINGQDTGYIIARKYNVRGVPFTAIFDTDKRLKSAYLGVLSGEYLSKILHE